jgi:hypothetical protein
MPRIVTRNVIWSRRCCNTYSSRSAVMFEFLTAEREEYMPCPSSTTPPPNFLLI